MILCAGIAGAHRASYSTTVVEETASPSPRPDFKVTGHLESPKDACVRNRTVKFLARTEDGTAVLLGTDRTNDRGALEAGRRHNQHARRADQGD